MWLQLDGCQPHFSFGQGLEVEWTLRSLDPTVMVYHLWGRVEHIVYQTGPESMEDMRNSPSTDTPQLKYPVLREITVKRININ